MRAIVFAILDCGFAPRCSAEIDDGSEIRIDKICNIIEGCKLAVHDLSRIEPDAHHGLPRFNMPLELGIFLGAKRFGERKQKGKSCLILDVERYRFQKFVSDIAGQDIKAHNADPKTAVKAIREWLQATSGRTTIPGGASIWGRYEEFGLTLPEICRTAKLELHEMTYIDFVNAAGYWLKESASE